jgi:hypothetical protein
MQMVEHQMIYSPERKKTIVLTSNSAIAPLKGLYQSRPLNNFLKLFSLQLLSRYAPKILYILLRLIQAIHIFMLNNHNI